MWNGIGFSQQLAPSSWFAKETVEFDGSARIAKFQIGSIDQLISSAPTLNWLNFVIDVYFFDMPAKESSGNIGRFSMNSQLIYRKLLTKFFARCCFHNSFCVTVFRSPSRIRETRNWLSRLDCFTLALAIFGQDHVAFCAYKLRIP